MDDLKKWIPSEAIFEWLQEGDAKAAAFQEEAEAAGTDQIANLFSNCNSDDDEEGSNGDDNDDDNDSNASDADYEGFVGRVRVWYSSTDNENGIGGKYRGVQGDAPVGSTYLTPTTNGKSMNQSTRIVYAISESWKGYGDMLWASSRHLANLFADPTKCRQLLQLDREDGLLSQQCNGYSESSEGQNHQRHPLYNLRLLELGAGCGVPSLMAMKCGAHVVCTDLDDPNRIRTIAESMERNWQEILAADTENGNGHIENGSSIGNMQLARACPFRWGASTEPVAKALLGEGYNNNGNNHNCFDVICATDCLFMPWLHYELLAGIQELLTEQGVAILAFCIHEAFSKDHEVWPFVDKAKEKGFTVEILDAVQLTPPKKGMDSKQGLVNMLRLTKKS